MALDHLPLTALGFLSAADRCLRRAVDDLSRLNLLTREREDQLREARRRVAAVKRELEHRPD